MKFSKYMSKRSNDKNDRTFTMIKGYAYTKTEFAC